MTKANYTYVVHYSSPAFHRNALENSEHGETNTVKTDDAELWAFPARRADRLIDRTRKSAAAEAAAAAVSSGVRGARRHLGLAGQVPVAFDHTKTRISLAARI